MSSHRDYRDHGDHSPHRDSRGSSSYSSSSSRGSSSYKDSSRGSGSSSYRGSSSRGQSASHPYQRPSQSDAFVPLTRRLQKDSFVYSFDSTLRAIVPDPVSVHSGTDFLVSKHVLPGIQQAVEKIKSENPSTKDTFVMCPVYWDKEAKTLADTQFAVTGSVSQGEREFRESCKRELTEELGITCLDRDLVEVARDESLPSKVWQKTTTYTLDATHAEIFNSSAPQQHVTDDKKLKVQVVVWGSLERLQDLTSQISHRADSRDLEGIRAIRLMSFDDFVAHLPHS
jgi:hypothetical protein